MSYLTKFSPRTKPMAGRGIEICRDLAAHVPAPWEFVWRGKIDEKPVQKRDKRARTKLVDSG